MSLFISRKLFSEISTQTKVIILSFLLIVGGGILAYQLSIQVVRERWVDSREKAGLASAEDEAREIHEWVDWEFARLNTTANYFSMLTLKDVDIKAALQGLRSSKGNRRAQTSLMFLSRSGRIVYSTSLLLPQPAAIEELRKKAHFWSRGTPNRTHNRKHAIISDNKRVLLAVPCFLKDGAFVGTLVSCDSASDSPFGRSIQSFEESRGKGMFLVDSNGITLARIGTDSCQLEAENLIDLLKSNVTGHSLMHDGDVYSYSAVPAMPWYVLVRQSSAGLESETNQVAGTILLIGLVSMGFLFLLSLWIVKILTVPVRRLVWAARTVVLDKFQSITLNLPGEIGELIGVFNKIGNSLNRSYKKLSILNSLGAALVSDIRENDISQRVVHAVSASMNVTACVLLLPDDKGELKPKSATGFQDCGTLQSNLWKYTVQIAKVVASKKPIIEQSLNFPNSGVEGAYPSAGKFIGVPLLLRDRTAGALAAFNCYEGSDFTELDVELLSTFANHAAVAIQNSAYFNQIEEDLQNIRRLKDELIQSEKMSALGQLVSGVAHELNNPMGVVTGYAELLQQTTSDEKLASYAARIREAGQRASGIVRNLLTFSRKQPRKTAPVNLNDVIESVLEILAHPLKLSNVQIRTDLQAGLSDVIGDRHELQQVFLNLATNAMQAMEDKEEARLMIRTSNQGKYVTAIVSDNGPGIPAEFHSRIFEPFFTTKPVGKGTGLGLSICYGIISDLQGSMRVESEPGSGASFIIELPALIETGVDSSKSTSVSVHSVKNPRVLVVDDEDGIREMLIDVLNNAGCKVIAAKDGHTALSALSSVEVDAIVSDLRMPAINGMEFFKICVQRYPRYAGKFIFVSGDTSADDARDFFEKWGGRVLHKPFAVDELTSLLINIADNGRQESAPPHNPL